MRYLATICTGILLSYAIYTVFFDRRAPQPSASSANADSRLLVAVETLSAQVNDLAERLDTLSSRCVLALPPGEALRVSRVPAALRP